MVLVPEWHSYPCVYLLGDPQGWIKRLGNITGLCKLCLVPVELTVAQYLGGSDINATRSG